MATREQGVPATEPLGLPPAAESESAEDLVVFGAPMIADEDIAEVVDTLRSGWIGTGPKTKRFETRFATYSQTQYAIATNSCTAALHLALLAVDVEPGDEVITSPLTFVATANVIEHCGARPVFADVRQYDGTIDPDEVAARVGERTKAIMPVHYAGALADVATLRWRHPQLPIVVDAAHAVEGRHASGAGAAGDGATAAAFSFYVTKNLVTGEGGMLVTDDEGIASVARIASLHGLDNDAWKRYSSGRYGKYELTRPGWKYNMTDIQASLGIRQLARIERSLGRRTEIWDRYNEGFADLPGVTIPPVALEPDAQGRHARHLYTLWLDWQELGRERQDVVEELYRLGVGTGWHFRAAHLHRYYQERYGYRPGAYPVAEAIADRTISLPLSAALTDDQVERVVSAVRSLAARPAKGRALGKR
jgi:dTDP-4-amino-4,6-dideoxygalactose transaminase